MGSFAGHALPGSFFIFFGIWLACRFSYQHFVPARKRSSDSRCRCPCNLDIFEGVLKIACSSLGFLLEQVTNGGPQFHLTNPLFPDQYQMGNNWSHCTMYTFFIFSGIADIIMATTAKLPFQGLQHLMLSVALLIEGYLFYFHTHGRAELDVRLHTLLVIAIWGGALSFFVLAGITGMQPKETAPIHDTNHHTKYTLLEGSNSENASESIQLDSQETDLYNSSASSPRSENSEQLELILQALERKLDKVETESLNGKSFPTFLKLLGATTILLQGTWFWQVAFALYPPSHLPWNPLSHANIEFATLFFAWHLASIIIFLSILCFVTYQLLKHKKCSAM